MKLKTDVMKYGLSENIVNRIEACVFTEKAVEKVIIFGSRAKGTFRFAGLGRFA